MIRSDKSVKMMRSASSTGELERGVDDDVDDDVSAAQFWLDAMRCR